MTAAGWLPDAIVVLVCATAVVTDVRRYQIPNWLSFGGLAAGLIVNATLGELGPALAGAGVLLLIAAPLGALRLLGLGDVKLLVAVGALVRWPLALHVPLFTALAGGVVALALALRRRVVPRPVHGSWTAPLASHRMPYGVAIAVGALWAIASRHVALLRLP